MRKSVCILSFSPIARDARVLRQIRYLAPFYDLTVIGYGPPHKDWIGAPHVKWIELPRPSVVASPQRPSLKTAFASRDWKNLKIPARAIPIGKNVARSNAIRLIKLLGVLSSGLYYQFWLRQWGHASALAHILSTKCDAYHANDWDALPAAAQAARLHNARLIADLHEYGPLEYEEQRDWWLTRRMVIHFLKEYGAKAQAWITVAPRIAERYYGEFGIETVVIRNIPERVDIPERKIDPANIALIHHGGASASRKPEIMIEAMKLCDSRYTLHLMFLENAYVRQLRALADAMAPGRVQFHDPVPPENIVRRISEFDIGLHFIPPTSYNNIVSLPNKFFDFIAAGLAVCIGPSPSMADIVRQCGLGCVTPTFEPADIAATLNNIDASQWDTMRRAAREAAGELNAAKEMEKLVTLYDRLFTAG